MFWGLLLLIGGSILLIPLENWIHRQLEGVGDFLAEHLYLPLARVLIVIGFLYCVFPQPLLADALVHQLNGQVLPHPPWKSLINAMFLIGLALPLLPQTQKFTGLILPVQSLIGAWLLIADLPLEVRLPEPGHTLGAYALLIIASHSLVNVISKQIAERQRWDPLSTYDCLILSCQPPLVLWVTRAFVVA